MRSRRANEGTAGRPAVARVALLLLVLGTGTALSQTTPVSEYRLGIGDQVQLGVLQQPDLDRALLVRPDGTIVVPLVGEVAVAGLTAREAGDLVRQRLRLFNREISDVTFTVLAYNSQRISVLGAVARPGEYTFPEAPSLWDAVRAAGGPLATANLAAIRVVRQEGADTRSGVHDLTPVLNSDQSVPPVPLQAGDTVVVPSRDEAVSVPVANSVQILGAVLRPGTITVTEPTRLVSALLLAGGPVENGDLSRISWVHAEGGDIFSAARVDLDDFLKRGSLVGNPEIHPGDTVRVPYRGLGFFRSVWPVVLSVVTAGTAIYLAGNR